MVKYLLFAILALSLFLVSAAYTGGVKFTRVEDICQDMYRRHKIDDTYFLKHCDAEGHYRE